MTRDEYLKSLKCGDEINLKNIIPGNQFIRVVGDKLEYLHTYTDGTFMSRWTNANQVIVPESPKAIPGMAYHRISTGNFSHIHGIGMLDGKIYRIYTSAPIDFDPNEWAPTRTEAGGC